MRRYGEALTCAERAVAMEPGHALAWEELGIAANNSGNHERALDALRKAVEVGKPTADIWTLQAIALSALGRDEAALEAVQEAIELDPRRPQLALGKAFILKELRRADEALACVAVAQELGASPEMAHQLRGNILALDGRYEEAARSFDAALSANPDDWDISVDREIAVGCLGRHGPAMEALPGTLSRISIPPEAAQGVLQSMSNLGAGALERAEVNVCLGLLNALTSMPTWRSCAWFGGQMGAFLRRVIEVRPQEFLAAVEIVRQNVTEEDVLRLLDPFLQAAEFVRTRDLTLLERLFPEVRGLVLDIVHRVAPELDDLVRPAR
jgi:tetratricopeptide (TPR) repeat protein